MGSRIKGALLVTMGIPTLALLKDTKLDLCPIEDGVVDSIKYLLFSQGFQKRNNLEHSMVNLPTKF
jgi:hypothetical protein